MQTYVNGVEHPAPPLVIDPEFKALIPALANDEYAQLEANIRADGCREALVVWRDENILVDGHHRYAICTQHGVPFATVYRAFDCREAVVVWMIENQTGRRNLPEPQRIEWTLKLKPAIAAMNEARRNAQLKHGDQSPVLINLLKREDSTQKQLAEKVAVSQRKFHQAETILTRAPAYIADLYRAQDITANRGYDLYKLLKTAPERVLALCEKTREDNVEKVNILLRLHKNGADTFTEIEQTGFIQPGEPHEAVQWETATAIQAQKALDLKAKLHAQEAVILRQQKKREDMAALGNGIDLPDALTLIHADFRDYLATLPENSVDLIFTDPPYDESSIPLYGDLACHASRILKPGGSLIAYAGHYALPRILTDMSRHLRYWWMLAIAHSGGNSVMFSRGVYVKWKPLVWFVKQERADNAYLQDLVHSELEDKKDLHDWQQGIAEARYYIKNLTAPGALVIDPFAGSGTTLAAALELGRRAIGIEKNSETVAIARGRLYAAAAN